MDGEVFVRVFVLRGAMNLNINLFFFKYSP